MHILSLLSYMGHIQVHIQAGEHEHAGAHGQVEVLGEEHGQDSGHNYHGHDQVVLMNTLRIGMCYWLRKAMLYLHLPVLWSRACLLKIVFPSVPPPAHYTGMLVLQS